MRGKYRHWSGKVAEKIVAQKVGGRRVGGPGKPDVVKGRARIEVKYRANPVTKPELKKCREKHRDTQVYSTSGYTKPALEYGKKERMKLHKGVFFSRRVMPTKKKHKKGKRR